MKTTTILSSRLLRPRASSGIRPQVGRASGRHGLATAAATTTAASSTRTPPGPPMPLKGVRVLDMTRVLAGPYCTQILGDLGADVIKVEHPTRGDDTRAWGPPYAKHVNRNKRSLGLSFATPEGQSILHQLVAQADVLVENYLPGTLKKYGMDYETLAAINPSLIYASITGYGQTGPWSSRAGYDVMIIRYYAVDARFHPTFRPAKFSRFMQVEAELGLMHITGARDGPPVKVGVAVTDLTTGLYTSNAILASLLSRSSTSSPQLPKGYGTHIDACLADCQVATLTNIATSALVSGQPDSGRWGTEHPSIVPYQAFPCKTSAQAQQKGGGGGGEDQILLGGGNDRLFAILSSTLKHPEWTSDPRFSTNAARVAHRSDLTHLIASETRKEPLSHWLRVFAHSGLPHAAVNDIQTTLQHPAVRDRGMVGTFEHTRCGPMQHVASPVVFRAAPTSSNDNNNTDSVGGTGMGIGRPSVRRPPPVLGEHTDEILMRGSSSSSSPPAAPETPADSTQAGENEKEIEAVIAPIWGLRRSESEVADLRERGVVA